MEPLAALNLLNATVWRVALPLDQHEELQKAVYAIAEALKAKPTDA